MNYAGFWIRSWAATVDDVLLNIVAVIIQAGALAPVYWLVHRGMPIDARPGVLSYFGPMFLQWMNAGIYCLLALPYYTYSHARTGTTPGKRLFGIQVVQYADPTQLPTQKQSLYRSLGYALSYALFGAGFLMVLFHPQKRGLHELLSGTCSIKKKKNTTL